MAEETSIGEENIRFCEKDYDEETGICTFTFGNGEVLTFDCDKASETIQRNLMFHGALQKIGDSYAGAKGDFAVGVASARAVIDLLNAGNWRAPRGAGTPAGPRIGELASALSAIKGYDVATSAAKVAALSDEDRKTLRANPRIKAAIAQIRAERAAEKLRAAEAKGDEALNAL